MDVGHNIIVNTAHCFNCCALKSSARDPIDNMFTPINALNTVLNNTAAMTSTDGVTNKAEVLRRASNIINNSSTYNTPISAPAVVASWVADKLSASVSIPSSYQSTVHNAVSNVIMKVLTKSSSPSQNTDISSPQYVGNISTRLFSEIRSEITQTSPSFGIPSTKAGPIVNAMSSLANDAVTSTISDTLSKIDSPILNSTQYDLFKGQTVGYFSSSYNSLPTVVQHNTETTIAAPTNVTIQQSNLARQTAGNTTPMHATSEQGGQQNFGITAPEDQRKVYIVSTLNAGDVFLFDTQPIIQVTEDASYSSFSPLHAPGEILSFKNNPARSFSISDTKLISRNAFEATKNLKYLHLLKGWTKPHFGKPANSSTTTQSENLTSMADTGIASTSSEPLAGATSESSAATSTALQFAANNRLPPIAYYVPPSQLDLYTGITQYSNDPINQSLITGTPMPTIVAANSRASAIANNTVANPVTTTLGAAGGGRGKQGGPTAEEFNSIPFAPITPTAASAQTIEPGSVINTFGSPPEVLYLYGYSDGGSAASDTIQNIRRIPVVITSLSYSYPNDVDYIPTTDGIPFPIVMTITIALKETKSPYELEQFSLQDFRQGKLIGW